MRKPVLAMLVLLLCLPILSAEQNETQENLYTLVVPTYYDMLSVTGCFGGGTAARMQIDLAPSAAFNFDVGAGANYDLFAQTVTTALSIDANLNSLFIGTSDSTSIPLFTIKATHWILQGCKAFTVSVQMILHSISIRHQHPSTSLHTLRSVSEEYTISAG